MELITTNQYLRKNSREYQLLKISWQILSTKNHTRKELRHIKWFSRKILMEKSSRERLYIIESLSLVTFKSCKLGIWNS